MASANILESADDCIQLAGRIRIQSYDARTGTLVDERTWPNLLTTMGRTTLLRVLAGTAFYTAGQYIAVGTGTPQVPYTSPQVSDTQLWGELTRAALTQTTVSSNQILFVVYFTSSQAIGPWSECGLIGSSPTAQASSAANTGVLVTHAALSYIKTSSYQTTLTYTIILS